MKVTHSPVPGDIVQDRVHYLENELMSSSQLYYTGASPYTDAEWDKMFDELTLLCPESPVLSKTGWGYDVFKDPTPGEKYEHKYGEAGSLKKAYTLTEMDKEFKDPLNNNMQISLKLDGLSVVLYYYRGKLIRALTRGDGHIGIDITTKIKVIMGTDRLHMDTEFTGAVRGEILMDNESWKKFHELIPESKNSRNSTAGLISMDTLKPYLLRYLKVVVYTVVGDESLKTHHVDMYDTRLDLRHWDFWLHQNFDYVVPSLEVTFPDSIDKIRTYKDLLNVKNTYPIDGVVFKRMNLIGDPETGGISYIAQAFKFDSEVARSEVVEVEWNLTKTRYLMPKVRIRPVQLAGTTVQYCTGYNAKYILDNGVGVGSIVEVEKHGEIIPNINKVLLKVDTCIPERCPRCSDVLVWNGVHLQCQNELCGNAGEQDLLVWINTLAEVDNFGSLLQLKFLHERLGDDLTVEKVMCGKPLSRYLLPLSGTGAQFRLFQQMIRKLYSDKYSLKQAITALNIPRFGEVTSSKLAQYPGAIKELLELLHHENDTIEDRVEYLAQTVFHSKYDLEKILGTATLATLIQNVNKLKRLLLIEDRIDWSTYKIEDKSSLIKVAVTGKLSVKRSDFERELLAHGYVCGEISRDTKFLITDDPASNSSKNQKAEQWGITKLSEQAFRNKYMK